MSLAVIANFYSEHFSVTNVEIICKSIRRDCFILLCINSPFSNIFDIPTLLNKTKVEEKKKWVCLHFTNSNSKNKTISVLSSQIKKKVV